jgi:transposase
MSGRRDRREQSGSSDWRFADTLDLAELGFEGVAPAETGRPAYHPSALLKLYVYGYLNRVQSGRRLERGAGRNVELMWLLGRLVPDHKTVADFRKDNGRAIRPGVRSLCRTLPGEGLLVNASVAIDGSKFKAVTIAIGTSRGRRWSGAGRSLRRASPAIWASWTPPTGRSHRRRLPRRPTRLKEKLAKLRDEMRRLDGLEARMLAAPDQQISLTDPDSRSMATSGRGSGVVGVARQSG